MELTYGAFDPEVVYGAFPPDVSPRPESSLARAERKRGISVPSLPCPSLVIYGDDFREERGSAIARLYGSDERDFPGLDHWDLVRDPRVREAIADFLAVKLTERTAYAPKMQKLSLRSERKTQLIDITATVRRALVGQSGQAAVVFVPHTTAGIALQASGAGADAVASDIEAALQRIVREDSSWKHTDEGDQNPWAHVRSVLTASSITIPLEDDGKLALGDLQTIFFCEFDGPRERKIYITVT